MMGSLLQLAKITSIVAGVVISLFLVNLLLLPNSLKHHFPSLTQYSWITSQLIIFTIFKLSTTKTNDVQSDASDHPPPPAASAESDPMESPSSTDGPSLVTLSPEGRGRGPTRLRKSSTWEGHCRRVAEAEAEAAVAMRRLKRWETFKKKVVKLEVEEEEDDVGLGRREELMAGKDELFQRVETFIKKHYDQLRLQQLQEVSQRRPAVPDSLHKPF